MAEFQGVKRTMVKILYIGGVGRSGSTLLGRMLNQMPGVMTAGEILAAWKYLSPDDTCECGKALASCSLWQAVFTKAFGGFEGLTEKQALASSVIPQRHIPFLGDILLRRDILNHPYRREIEGQIWRFYQALVDVSEGMIVDTSKRAPYAYFLSQMEGIDLRIVWLTRDSRGVAHSWTKKKLELRFHPLRTAIQWDINNLLLDWMKRQVPVLDIRYEDLIADPRGMMADILAFADHPVPPEALQKIHRDKVFIKKGHSLEGNPNRFQEGWIPIRHDDAWKSRMNPLNKAAVTALTFPWLLRHGYIGLKREACERLA